MNDRTVSSKKKLSNSADRLTGTIVAFLAFGLYFYTLAPTVLEADAGEFQFVAWLPGIAHPTGYPLYMMLGWLWTHLIPLGDVAWRMNLLSAVLAAMAVGMTFAVARRLLTITRPETPPPAQRVVAAISAAIFAATPAFWSQAIIAEVYALHLLFITGLLWLALSCREAPGRSRWVALVFGLSLTHHVTTVLLLPALLVFLGLIYTNLDQRTFFTSEKVKQISLHILLMTAPLLLYLYLPLIAPATPYATLSLSERQALILYDHSLAGFLRHVSGAVFTGELQPAAVGIERLLFPWQLLYEQVGGLGIVFSAVGVLSLWFRRQLDVLILTGLSFLAVVAFNLIYFIGDIFVLFIPAWLIVCLWIGVGILEVVHWLVQNFVRRKVGPDANLILHRLRNQLQRNAYRSLMLIVPLFFFIWPALMVATRYADIDQSDNLRAGQRWQKILAEPLPDDAVLLSNDRNEMMPMWYYQYVENRRPDLLGLFPLITTDPAFANVGLTLDQALASERPVYLIKPMEGLSLKADLKPEGTLFRAKPWRSSPAYTRNLSLPENVVAFPNGGQTTESITLLGYDLSSATLSPGEEVAITLYWQVTQELQIDYTSYVHLVTQNGAGVTQSDHRPGGNIYPSSHWSVGEVLRDQHTLTLPDNAPGGEYQLRAGMYHQPQPGVITGMGNGVEIGSIAIKTDETQS